MNGLNPLFIGLASALVATAATSAPPPATNAPPPAAPAAAAAPANTATPVAPKAAPATNGSSPATAVVSPAAAAPSATNRNIRFQFDGMPYAEVLERFAQMADKPLVQDTKIEGTLTFNDPQPYTYAEALDTLNLMLSMKGMMLVETGHYLQLVPFKELPQMPLKIFRGTDPTGDVRPGEVVTVVLELKNLEAREVTQSITPMLSSAGSIAPLSRGQGLILTDRLASIQRIRHLLNQIDTEASVTRQMKTFTLVHASGAIVADLINKTFGAATAPKRTSHNAKNSHLDILPPDPADYVTSIYDDASRTMVLWGPTERIALAEDLIKRFEEKGGAGGDIRIYYPQDLQIDQLAQMIRQAIPGVASPSENAPTKARLLTDSTQNRIIVVAPIPGQLEAIDNFINQVDQGAKATGSTSSERIRSETIQVTKVFRPRTAEPATVAKILTEALTRRLPSGATGTTANVSVEPGSQTVVVSGSPSDVQIAFDILTQLEEGTVPTEAMQTRFFDLGTPAEAKRLQPLLEQLYRNQVGEPASKLPSAAKILAEPGSGRLIVTASPEHLALLEKLLKDLQAQPALVQARRLEIFTLKNTRVDALQKSLADLVSERMTDKRFADVPKPLITPDAPNNRFLVTATDDQLKEVQQVLLALDIEPPIAPRQTRILALQHLRADTALANIQSLLNERLNSPRFAGQPKPTLTPDAANNRLLVTASADQLKEVEEVLQILDIAPETARREMKVILITSKSAGEILNLTTQLMAQLVEAQPNPQLAPRLIPDPSGRQIIALATAPDLERLEAFIRQLDTAAATAAARQFKAVELYSRTAAELTPLVQQLYQEQLRGLAEPQGGAATLLAEPKNNRIMVSGSDAEIARVTAIIRQLDPESLKGTKEETRVVRLKAALAAELAALVEKSLNAQAQTIKVLVDARSNSLVLTGDSAAVEAASKVIEQLDTRSDMTPREMRILDLRSGDATTLAPMLTSLFTEMIKDQRGAAYVAQTQIVPDPTSNRLIVTGPKLELELVADLVKQLDQTAGQSGSARVFKLESSDAAVLAPIVSNAMLRFDARGLPIRKVTVAADLKSNSLIVTGSRTDLQDAAVIIEGLDGDTRGFLPGGDATRQLKIIKVNADDPAKLAELTLRVFAAQNLGRNLTNVLTLTPEPIGKRLIVLAPPSMIAQVETVVATLDLPPGQDARELTSIELTNASAAELLPAVTRIYTEQSQGKPLKPATIYPDSAGKRFTVYGTKEQAATLRQIVATLESESRPPRESRVFDLGTPAEAQRVLPLIQQLYRDQLANDPAAGPADAQMIPDRRTGRILVTARKDHLDRLDTILATLQPFTDTNLVSRETRAFDVGRPADVERLLPLVQQLYQEQWKDKIPADPADAKIMGDARAGRIIVTGRAGHVKHIETIFQQLGVPVGPDTNAPPAKVKTADRETRVIDLTAGNAVELATTVRTLYLDQVRSRLGSITPDTMIMSDANANRLILVGDPAELAEVEGIVAQLDKTSTQSASARVFRLKSADPSKVAEILTTGLVTYDSYGRPRKRVTISVDSSTRTIIATGDPKELQAASVIIEQLDASLGPQAERLMKVVSLKKNVRVTELYTKIQQLYQDQVKNHPELGLADALVLPDAASNQLILAGSAPQLELIEKVITDLQAAQADQAPRETRMLQVGTADEVQRLFPLVQQLYQEQWRDQSPSDPADAQIMQDAQNGRFIVTARTNHLAAIETILHRLQAGTTPAEARETRIYDLTSAMAMELASTVRSLYLEQAKARPGSTAAETIIQPDAGANRLIVCATTNELRIVEDIITKLDKVSAQSASARVFRLKSADPAKVSEILQSALVTYDSYGRPRKRITVSVDPNTRTLIATGDPKELQAASVIIEQLDTSLGTQIERLMKVVALTNVRSAELVTQVQQLYQDRVKSEPELGIADALILADATSNQLILAGSEAQLKLIEEIVAQISRPAAAQGPRETRFFPIGQPDEVLRIQTLLQQLYTDLWKNKEAHDPADAKILADEQNGRLVVTARKEHLAEIEKLLAQVHPERPAADSLETRVYDLQATVAAELAATVKTLYQEQLKSRPGAPVSLATVLPDQAANRLIVSAPTNELAAIDAIITKLDEVSAQSGRARVFKLKSADAEQVATVLSTALIQTSPYGRQVPRISVGTDKQNNLVILSGEPKDLQAASAIIDQMDTAMIRDKRLMRIFALTSGVATEVSDRVQQLYEDQVKGGGQAGGADALILGDDVSNRLIVTASESHMKLLEDIVTQLQQAAEGTGRQIRVLMLHHNSAASVATMLSQLFWRETRSTDPGQRLVVTASPDDHTLLVDATSQILERVETLVHTLDSDEAKGAVEVRTYLLPEGSAMLLAQGLSRLYMERGRGLGGPAPRFEGDPISNILLVSATKTQFEQIDKLITELKTTVAVTNEIRTFVLKQGNPEQVAQVLEQMLSDNAAARRMGFPDGGSYAARFARGRNLNEVRVVPAQSLNAVVVQGPPEKLALAEQLVKTLDSEEGPGRWEVRTYQAPEGGAFTLAQSLQRLFAERGGRQRSGMEPRFEADAAANMLMVGATREQFEQIDKLILELKTAVSVTNEIRTLVLKHGDPDQVARVLEDMLASRSRGMGAYPQDSSMAYRFGRFRSQADLRIAPAASLNAIVLQGPPDKLALAEQLVKTLDSDEGPGRWEVRTYQTPEGTAPSLAQSLQRLFTERGGERGPSRGGAMQPRFEADTGNFLMVGATREQFEQIDKLITELKASVAVTNEIRTFVLKHGDPDQVSRVLEEMLSPAGGSSRRFGGGSSESGSMPYSSRFGRPRAAAGDVRVSSAASLNAVVVQGPPGKLVLAEQLIKSLDTPEGQGDWQVRTYPAPEGSAVNLAQSLQRLFAERSDRGMRGDRGRAGLEPRFEADSNANLIMVGATKEQFVQIDKLVQELMQSAGATMEIRTFILKHAEPEQIATVLSDMLADRSGAGPGYYPGSQFSYGGYGRRGATSPRQIRVAPAVSLNAVVVQGPPDKLAEAEKLIATLDKEDPEGQNVIQTVHLAKGQAEDIAEAVTENIAQRVQRGGMGRDGTPRTRLQRVNVTAVAGANSLLIHGPGDAVREVMEIIKGLDLESKDTDIEVRIYKLENGTAKEVSAILEQLLLNVYRTHARSRSTARIVQPTVSIDEPSNSLVISGAEFYFNLIEKVLPTLDKAPERAERDIEIVWLQNARAFDVAFTLQSAFAAREESDQPLIESDSMANTLTLIAKRADIVQLKEMIARLDEPSQDTSLQIRLRPISGVPATQMLKMLTNIYPQMAAGQIRVVDKIPTPLPSRPDTTATNPPSATPAPGPAPAAPATNTPPASSEVVIAVEIESNSLLLAGTSQDLDEVDRIISELSFSFIAGDAEFRLFALKEADPVIVARTLNELFREPAVQVQPQQPRQGDQPQQPGEPQRHGDQPRVIVPKPKLTVVPEPRTRSVIVRAKPSDFPLVEKLINQLDAAGLMAQLDFRVVSLTNAEPEKVVALVQDMVKQMAVVRPGDPLTVSVNPRSRGLLLVARPNVLERIEQMVRALDVPSEFAEAEVLVVSLKRARAPQLAGILQAMLRPGAQNELTPEARELQEQVRRLKIKNDAGQEVVLDLSKPIKILADPQTGAGAATGPAAAAAGAGSAGGNRLILTSTADNLKALRAVIEMMDSVPIVEGVDVKLVSLKFADAATVSQTLNSIFTLGRRLAATPVGTGEPESGEGKALVHMLNVAADSRLNTLILSGRAETLDLALKVVADLDREGERYVTDVKLFRLKHASATRILPLLRSVFAEGPAVPGTEGLSTMVTRLRTFGEAVPRESQQPKSRAPFVIQADDISNILVVAARSDALPLIQDVLEQLDIPSASGMDTLRIYALNHADATALQRIINDLHTGPRAVQLRREDIPNVTVDPRINAMIVSGSSKAFGIIDSLVKQLDQTLPFELRDIKILPLQNADAAVVAGTLQQLMDARVTQRAALDKQQADLLKVIVLADPRSNSLLVGGSKDSFELVAQLAQQLDGASPALSGRIRLIPLVHADPRATAASLVQLFSQRYAAARTPDVQRQRPIIVADPRSNALLVSAGMDDNQAIDELLKRLDVEITDPNMTVAILPLQHNDSTRVASALEATFQARLRSRQIPGQPVSPTDQVNIETDALNNALIVYGSKENHELIQGLLAKIDVEPMARAGLIQTFTLEFADAQRVADMLQDLVRQGLYRPGAATRSPGARGPGAGGARDAMAVAVDPRSNTLIVSASPENMLIIREVIKNVDTKDLAEVGNVRVYELKKARASSLATVLTQFFAAKRQGEALAINAPVRTMPVAAIPDDRSNTLLVTAGKESFDILDRLIEQLDTEDVFSRMNFRVFVLRQVTATKLQATLQQIFANRPPRVRGEPPDPITIVADSWVNALIVGASVEDLDMVASLVERLDSEQTETGLSVQVLPLAKANATRVAQTIQGLFREGAPGAALPVTVTADERINAIVVSAGQADAKRIGELVKKLDTDQVAKVSEIRVFPLQYARADSLSTILNQALNQKPTALSDENPNAQSLLQFIARSEDGKELITAALREAVLITPDARMNSLIVSGPVDYMGLIEQIITRLDSSSPQLAKIRVFQLKNADARQMAELLTTLFRMQQAAAATQRSVQYTLVRSDLTGQDIFGPEAPPSATIGTAEQSALTVTVDLRTNSLLVGGTEHYVALVSEIVTSLDLDPGQERKSEVYRLKNAQADEVATALRTFLDQARQRITQTLGVEAVGTAQRLLEQEVAIVADPTSNTLLVSANPRYFKEVRELIEQLDLPQAQVLIQALLAEVTLDNTFELGVEWTYTGSHGQHNYLTGTDFGIADAVAAFGGYSAAVTGNDYSFLLRALKNDGRLEILSRPQILTADNRPASIHIGQRVPLITNSRVTDQGDSINSFTYENVGVNLTVTPRISPDGLVSMEVSTTNSAISSSSVDISPEASIPIINERKASTFLSVQSGQTVIIGGLIASSDDKRVKKMPLLGDIPVLGALFRSTKNTKDRKELLILLTPQVLASRTNETALISMEGLTREQLDHSTIKDEIKRDNLQKRLLDPLFPEPSLRTNSPSSTATPHSQPQTNSLPQPAHDPRLDFTIP
ncbi:MAG: hypothetical protein JXQ71_17125 [Verrucomicrobia bacterium]|nr:hypothetical protein [Verrucomicrobiota bacterium]